jgi:BASS family bile acid:Na+ symporter
LGLVLIFDFFPSLGGMAMITAWWGIWHVLTGSTLGFVWSKVPIKG